MLRTPGLSDASSGRQLGPQIRFLEKPARDRCLNQGESVERQAVGGRVVNVRYSSAVAVSLSAENGSRRELGGPSGSGVRSGSCGHQDVRGNGEVVCVCVCVCVLAPQICAGVAVAGREQNSV